MRYKDAGVDEEKERKIMRHFLEWIEKTHLFFPYVKAKMWHFAQVCKIGEQLLAFCCDGVGTKIIVAKLMGRFDTIGIDCIAMCVNDLLCVGARPFAFLDYIATEKMDEEVFLQIAKGLYEGAEKAYVAIIGGEVAQLPGLIHGVDIVGMGIGNVDRIIEGKDIQEGDVLLGVESSGVHSNGLSLARKIFFEEKNLRPSFYIEELGHTLGEELLIPTHIYVSPFVKVLEKLNVKAAFHITGGGFLNLKRMNASAGFIIENIEHIHPIFFLIKEEGDIEWSEMFSVFNMGVGFCFVVDEKDVDEAINLFSPYFKIWRMGYAIMDSEKRIRIRLKEPRLEIDL